MNKGERTKVEILNQSVRYCCQYGLSEITIGTISKLCNLSRTGVISHFKNKEDMQIAILQHGEALFLERVIKPSWHADPLIHIINLLEAWSDWSNRLFNKKQISCPFIKALVEFQNRPASVVRTAIISQQNRFIDYLAHRVERCIEQEKLDGTMKSTTIAYELYSFYLGHTIIKDTSSTNTHNEIFKNSVTRLLKQYQV